MISLAAVRCGLGPIGVTDNTVRSQIKSIFSKTGVRRQSDLVRLLVSYSGPTIEVGSPI
jgi:hypothetical protein